MLENKQEKQIREDSSEERTSRIKQKLLQQKQKTFIKKRREYLKKQFIKHELNNGLSIHDDGFLHWDDVPIMMDRTFLWNIEYSIGTYNKNIMRVSYNFQHVSSSDLEKWLVKWTKNENHKRRIKKNILLVLMSLDLCLELKTKIKTYFLDTMYPTNST